MEAAAQRLQEPGTDADADLLVHTLLAAWREEKAAMREEAAARDQREEMLALSEAMRAQLTPIARFVAPLPRMTA